MKYTYIFLFLFATAGCATSRNAKNAATENTDTATSRNLIIYYDPAVGNEGLLKAVAAYEAKLLYDYENLHGIAIQIPSTKSMDKATSHFKKIKGVVSVNRDEIMKIN